MRNTKMRTALIALALLALCTVLASPASALSATPAQKTFYYESGKSFYGSFTVTPSRAELTEISLSVEGDLKDYITLSTVAAIINDSKEFSYTVNPMPQLGPGTHSARIIVNEEPPAGGGTSGRVSIHYMINMFMPFSGKYLEPSLSVDSSDTFMLRFNSAIENKGSEPVTGVDKRVDIYSGSEKIATLYKAAMLSGTYDVLLGYKIPGETEPKILALPWLKVDIGTGEKYEDTMSVEKTSFTPGEYEAKLVVSYDDTIKEVAVPFTIGEMFIAVNLLTEAAVVNKTNELLFVASSDWNSAFDDVYLTAEIKSVGERPVAALESPRFDIIPGHNTTITLQWATNGTAPGTYTIETVAHYKDMEFRKEFSIPLETTERPMAVPQYGVYLLAIVIVAIVAFMAAPRRKKKRR